MFCNLNHRNRDPHLLSSLIDLLHVLWFTNLGQKEKQVDEVQSSAEEKPKNLIKCLPLPLINEFLCVALEFTKYLRYTSKNAILVRSGLQVRSGLHLFSISTVIIFSNTLTINNFRYWMKIISYKNYNQISVTAVINKGASNIVNHK